MSAELIIYGAAYGPEDVTAKVRNFCRGQKLSFTVSNSTFGKDPWQRTRKTLVVVYTYNTMYPQVHTIIIEEGSQCVINPPSQPPSFPKDRLDSTDLKAIQLVSSRQMKAANQSLVILGAAYGMKNVTQSANEHLSPDGEFDQLASSDVWGDTWPGHRKTLVVVYEYDGLQMLDAVKENERMQFIASPPMMILNAAFGLADVTNKVRKLVKNRSLTVTANNETFGDSWPGVKQTLVVIYQYGEEIPLVRFVKENETLKIIYIKQNSNLGPTNPNVLTILAAAYGPSNVTQVVQSLVKGNMLQIKIDNGVLGSDPWPDVKKSLVVVYKYGRNPPLMKIVPEGDQISIDKVVLPHVGLVDTNNLLNNGDTLAFCAVNSKYISCDSNNVLVAVRAVPDDGCAMIIQRDSQGYFFKMQCSNEKYVRVKADAGSALCAISNVEEATMFSASVSVAGSLRLATKDGMYVKFDSNDNSLRADCVDQFSANTIFGVAFKQISDGLSQFMLNAHSLSKHDLALASLIWKLSGGYFLAIGLGSFISTSKVNPGVLGLVKSNPTTWKAIKNLVKAITNGIGHTGALITSLLGVIGVFYHEGLLWTIFKEMLKPADWIHVTWALGKIIEVVFLPEAEAAELLASFNVWGVQTVQAGLDVAQASN